MLHGKGRFITLKDAYYSVPILPENQRYLKFYFRGKLYQFTSFLNGLCSGPRKFTKFLKPPLSLLRLQEVTVAGFIKNDLITLGKNFVECERNIKLIVTLLESLEFVVHRDKSIFVSAKSIEYLGFITHSQKIMQLYHKVLQEEFLKFARLLGKFSSIFPAVCFGPLHNRLSKRVKIFTPKFSKRNSHKNMDVSQTGEIDILWWINNIQDTFNPNCKF